MAGQPWDQKVGKSSMIIGFYVGVVRPHPKCQVVVGATAGISSSYGTMG